MLLLLYHAIHAIYDDPVTALCHDAVTALYSMIYCAVCYCAYYGDPVAAVCEIHVCIILELLLLVHRCRMSPFARPRLGFHINYM